LKAFRDREFDLRPAAEFVKGTVHSGVADHDEFSEPKSHRISSKNLPIRLQNPRPCSPSVHRFELAGNWPETGSNIPVSDQCSAY